MKVHVTRLGCCVPLTKRQWARLEKLDYLDVVNPTLVAAGALANSVEYLGHFGQNIFFDVDAETSKPESVLAALSALLTPNAELCGDTSATNAALNGRKDSK